MKVSTGYGKPSSSILLHVNFQHGNVLRVRFACRVVWFRNSQHLSVNASISRDIRTRGMLGDVVATRTNRWTCPLGVCSYVLETLEVVNLARN